MGSRDGTIRNDKWAMTTGEKIKRARMQKGINQKELAQLLDVTPSTVAQWETGRRNPKKESLGKIADALEVNVKTFFSDGLDEALTTGEKIRLARERNHLSQKDLADLLNVSQNAIFNWENEKRSIKISTLQRIAGVLHEDVSNLLPDKIIDDSTTEGSESMTNTDLPILPLKMSEREDLIDKLKAVIELLETAKDMADTTGHEMEVDRIAFTILSEIMASVQEAAELPFC